MKRVYLAFVAILAAAFAATTAPKMAEAQSSDYRIRAGDVIGIEVLQDPSLNREVLILPDGRFSFPFAGTVRAGGRTTGQVERSISAGIASNFSVEPNVFVTVRSLRPEDEELPGEEDEDLIKIYFLGEVNAPGIREVTPGTTLLQALSQSGGLSNFAATRRIQLRRTNPTTNAQSVTTIDYRALSRGASLEQDIILAEGDIILVPERRLFE
ncbi:MAG: polysaccharide biosynthesis/export family protein [Pseudomonadota bacterium]